MAEVTLEVTRRERSGKEYAKKLRQENKIPAVVYGGHKEPVAITVERLVPDAHASLFPIPPSPSFTPDTPPPIALA